MARAVAFRHPEPFASINITPLIDVMLVLLIMIILTIPAMTHKIPVTLPSGKPAPPEQVQPHRLDIDAAGTLLWDGRAIADRDLPGLLSGAAVQGDRASLLVHTDPAARYERFAATLATVRHSGIERLAFVGNEQLVE